MSTEQYFVNDAYMNLAVILLKPENFISVPAEERTHIDSYKIDNLKMEISTAADKTISISSPNFTLTSTPRGIVTMSGSLHHLKQTCVEWGI